MLYETDRSRVRHFIAFVEKTVEGPFFLFSGVDKRGGMWYHFSVVK